MSKHKESTLYFAKHLCSTIEIMGSSMATGVKNEAPQHAD